MFGGLATPRTFAQPRLQRVQSRGALGQFGGDFGHLLVGASHFFALHALAFARRGDFLLAAGNGLAQLLANLAVVRRAALGLNHAVADGLHDLARRFDLLLEFAQTRAMAGDGRLAFLQRRGGFVPTRFEGAEFFVQIALRTGNLVVLAADKI